MSAQHWNVKDRAACMAAVREEREREANTIVPIGQRPLLVLQGDGWLRSIEGYEYALTEALGIIFELLVLLDEQERIGSDLECEGDEHGERCLATRARALLAKWEPAL
jgi:hypothetical protein